MKTEPELIDIYAMFALIAAMQKPLNKSKSKIDIAYEAFAQAQTMIEVRDDFVSKKGHK